MTKKKWQVVRTVRREKQAGTGRVAPPTAARVLPRGRSPRAVVALTLLMENQCKIMQVAFSDQIQ